MSYSCRPTAAPFHRTVPTVSSVRPKTAHGSRLVRAVRAKNQIRQNSSVEDQFGDPHDKFHDILQNPCQFFTSFYSEACRSPRGRNQPKTASTMSRSNSSTHSYTDILHSVLFSGLHASMRAVTKKASAHAGHEAAHAQAARQRKYFRFQITLRVRRTRSTARRWTLTPGAGIGVRICCRRMGGSPLGAAPSSNKN